MILFNGLEEILKCVIENTSPTDKIRSNEQRLHDAMKAIFGEAYPDLYTKPPQGITPEEMMELHKRHKNGESQRSLANIIAKRKLKKPKQKAYKTKDKFDDDMYKYEDQITYIEQRILQHYKRRKKFYDKASTILDDKIPEDDFFSEMNNHYEAQRQKIFNVLRECDWPI